MVGVEVGEEDLVQVGQPDRAARADAGCPRRSRTGSARRRGGRAAREARGRRSGSSRRCRRRTPRGPWRRVCQSSLISSKRQSSVTRVREAHARPGSAPPLGRAAGIEDLKAVRCLVVQRQVRVAEDDGVGAREAAAHALEAAGCGAGVVDDGDACAVGVELGGLRQGVVAPRGRRRSRGRRSLAERRTRSSSSTESRLRSPAWTIRSAASSRSTQPSGSRRVPFGMWVSEMIAMCIEERGGFARSMSELIPQTSSLGTPAPVAQWIERCPPEAEAAGSNPAGRARCCDDPGIGTAVPAQD